ncbi:autoinducer binding domain-containing protein [Microvirga sp. W0021]|uniref:Autoinducer binding domain-containing protein n=1 Tax=Hohaiivirga grylli TaxID=3133970 RepID=A0ABV0BJY5_9HYPH
MNTAFEHLIDSVGAPISETGLRHILHKFASECGSKYFCYLDMRNGENFVVSNYPKEWQGIYFEKNYFRVDPVVTQAKRGSYIYNWASADNEKNTSRDVANFFGDATEFGIRSGFSITVPTGFGHKAIITVASDLKDLSTAHTMNPQLAMVAATMIHKSLNHGETDIKREINLTPREATCLRWLSEGKSMQEISDILGIGARSVRFYLDEAKTKLSAINTVQAVYIATRLNLI